MNRNIGERQRWAWITAASSAIIAAELCGYSWIWATIGGIVVMGYHLYMDRVVPEQGIAAAIAVGCGKVGKVLAAICLIWNVVILAWAAELADKAFPMVDGFPILGWILLAVAAWGSQKGTEACASCSGILCMILLGLYGLIAVFSVGDIRIEYLKELGEETDGVAAAGLLLAVCVVWYLPCRRKGKKRVWDLALASVICTAALCCATAGVLTPQLARRTDVPLYVVAQSVSLFGVMERIEPLLSAALTMGVFSLLSAAACGCLHLGNVIVKCKHWGSIGCIIAGVMMFPVRQLTGKWIMLGNVVVLCLVPIVVLLCQKRKFNY